MPPRRDEGPPMSAREARGLRYESETPKFLQQLHAQVHGTRFEAERSRPPSKADETDPVLSWLDPTGAATSSSSRASQSGGNTVDAYDSDNDLDYAQIVVLKEGKHLTEEQYQQTKQAAAHSPTSMQGTYFTKFHWY
ncbi:hypothetical protein ACI68E_002435 [Malassezia pachydermatis]|uniref:DUF4604 domain-containing protein n=1 Tax=Malassezia pachydermatis TaxID=77020 RepID=A0A0M8MUS5_9BASI|nr:hypothetical protein Malapachy_0755 [Malassezia pachydermatis]KOS14744.1 hypothetical protein Malapachy_0755 [Malassezia pachydermatis]